YLNNEGIKPITSPDLRTALLSLQKKELDAVVYDAPMLMYLVKEMGLKVQLLPGLFDQQSYGIGIADNNAALKKQINVALLSLSENSELIDLDKKFFGEVEK
ncbi:MAG: transporter substrate-binding domain-containing protein, partial [Chthoniobacterales bacterium]